MTFDDVKTMTSAEVEAALPGKHPAAYYIYAQRLFSEGRKDDAVFWAYAGQLRYRFHLSANPALSADGDPAVFASLHWTVGQTINGYAGGDTKMWVTQIDRVLSWDEETSNGFTSKEKYKMQWQETRSGLLSLRQTIIRDAENIRLQREAVGLPNKAN